MEDSKLRLYVGRVPRDEYLKLCADGWTSTPKQSCDFVATWTPGRRDTCLEYADVIEDEDQPPEERAADRAERFGDYRDKRTSEATGHADSYDAGPHVHGYQSEARAERSACRHDRIADRARDAWSKAEYWQHRTAGVISHALYKSTPGVRMGRIKILEAELRKHAEQVKRYAHHWNTWQKVAAIADPAEQTKAALLYTGHTGYHDYAPYVHPRTGEESTSLYGWLSRNETEFNSPERQPITGAEAVALFFAHHSEPALDSDRSRHYELRLAYENQMLEAQGGRLEQCEVLPGGKLGGKLILKVSKSTATGRATSADVLGPKVSSYAYKMHNIPGTEFAAYKFDLERLSPEAYTLPTPESLVELTTIKAKIKAAAPKSEPCPLINPTDADAERLQALINARELAEHEKKNTWHSTEARKIHTDAFKPAQVCRLTQAQYSANSKGTYTRAETRGISGNREVADRVTNMYVSHEVARRKRIGPPVCQVRFTDSSKGAHGWYIETVIVITDKPQKPFPAVVWEKYTPAQVAEVPRLTAKFWNYDCGHQEQTSAIYDVKICSKCQAKMHDDTAEIANA